MKKKLKRFISFYALTILAALLGVSLICILVGLFFGFLKMVICGLIVLAVVIILFVLAIMFADDEPPVLK